MALDPVVNFFRSEIATLPLASGGTSMVITTGDGNKLPNPAVDGAFNLTIYNASDPFVTPEIVRCTAKSGDTLTITRAQEGTTATNKTSGSTWYVELTPTAKTIQDIDSAKLDVAGGTMTGDLTIPDKIIHSGDTNTAIRFPANDTFAVETAGSERLRVLSDGKIAFGGTTANGDFDFIKNDQTNGATVSIVNSFNGSSWELNDSLGSLQWVTRDATVGEPIRAKIQVLVDNNASTFYPSSSAICFFNSFGLSAISEKMRIASDGNVGIGTTSPATKLDVNGDVTITDKIIHSGDTNTAIRFPSADTFTVETNGTEVVRVNSSQNVGIGTTSPATKLDVSGAIRASTGILFGTDTAAANTLDDYEEGTWTPGFAFGGNSVAMTYSTQLGFFTKIGRLVTVSAFITLTDKGTSTGNATITGLPFTAFNYYSGVSFSRLLNITFADIALGYPEYNTDTIVLRENTNAGANSALTNADFANNSSMFFSVTYFTST